MVNMTTQHEERIPRWTRGDRLRKARSLTGLTTREFAEKIGVSHGTISNAETDARVPRRIVFNAWALATGVPVEWLMDGVEPEDGPGPDPAGARGVNVQYLDSERLAARSLPLPPLDLVA